MGLAETKIRVDGDIINRMVVSFDINVDIPGYEFISVPSLSNTGGVAFYIKNDLNFSIWTDITTSNQSFEALWIEINADGQPNFLPSLLASGFIKKFHGRTGRHFTKYLLWNCPSWKCRLCLKHFTKDFKWKLLPKLKVCRLCLKHFTKDLQWKLVPKLKVKTLS